MDNFDSFVYNLVQYVGELGAEPLVYRNDAIDVASARSLRPTGCSSHRVPDGRIWQVSAVS